MTREEELIARIKRGEPIAKVRMWWLKKIADEGGELMHKDLSPFEQAFFNQIVLSYEAWQREQQNADKTSTTH